MNMMSCVFEIFMETIIGYLFHNSIVDLTDANTFTVSMKYLVSCRLKIEDGI